MATDRVLTIGGRQYGVADGGDPDGVPIVWLHGTPTCRLIYRPIEEDARRRQIRILGIDRSGYGHSDPRPGRSVADDVRDVAAVADALGLGRFGVWGMSGGGPHALACAALLPGRVPAVAVLGGVAPYEADGLDWLEGMGGSNLEEFAAIARGPEAVAAFLAPQRDAILRQTPEEILRDMATLVGDADRAALTGALATWFADGMREALRPGIDGWRDDDLAMARPWGFDVRDIRTPVAIWHGDDDRFVPIAHARWLASRIPGAEAHLLPGEGHLSILDTRIGAVHAWLRAKIAPPAP